MNTKTAAALGDCREVVIALIGALQRHPMQDDDSRLRRLEDLLSRIDDLLDAQRLNPIFLAPREK